MRKLSVFALLLPLSARAESSAPPPAFLYPKPAFLKLAKSMGAKFSFGSNNSDDKTKDLTRWFEAIDLLDLRPSDFWQPKHPKNAER